MEVIDLGLDFWVRYKRAIQGPKIYMGFNNFLAQIWGTFSIWFPFLCVPSSSLTVVETLGLKSRDHISGTSSLSLSPLRQRNLSGLLMGTIDLSAAANETLSADLSGHVHQVPCCIRFDGPSQVSNYFKPKSSEVEVDGVRTEEAHFRGRKLQGATISLPSGYSGLVLGQASNKNVNGKRKASIDTEEYPCWEVKAKFDKMTYWNHDTLPSKDDTILRSFHWFSIAEALHKPVTVEDLVAVTDNGKI